MKFRFDLDELDEISSMISNDYYKERKTYKDLTFGNPKKKKQKNDY